MKHIVLGAGGSIGNALAGELLRRGEPVRLVSRRGIRSNGAESIQADLLDAASVRKAILPGATVYLLAGLPYVTEVWREQWPKIMQNTIEACAASDAALIFFDNVYMYGRVDGAMTENTAVNPVSRKGEVRARIAGDLLAAAKAGRVKGCIARAADLYGSGTPNSVPHQLVFLPLSKGKAAQWLVNAHVPHSFTYTPDCGRALPLLASSADAWGEVWHLPTAAPPPSGAQFVERAAQVLGAAPRLKVLRPWMVRVAGLFNATIRELNEMLYQYEVAYVFDSTKFEKRFGFAPTPYERGIAETAGAYRPV